MVKVQQVNFMKEFVEKYYPSAKKVAFGVPPEAILIQAALESGYGEHAPQYNFFGIKYNPKIHKRWQRLATTEYAVHKDAFPPEDVISCEWIEKKEKYKFRVYRKFAAFDTPEEAFANHRRVLGFARYKPFIGMTDPVEYLINVWKAGYATDPDYDDKVRDLYAKMKPYFHD